MFSYQLKTAQLLIMTPFFISIVPSMQASLVIQTTQGISPKLNITSQNRMLNLFFMSL